MHFYAPVAVQVLKVLYQIMENIFVIWPPFVSQEVLENVFESLTWLLFKMIHGIFEECCTYGSTNLRVSKNTCLQLMVRRSAKRPTICVLVQVHTNRVMMVMMPGFLCK